MRSRYVMLMLVKHGLDWKKYMEIYLHEKGPQGRETSCNHNKVVCMRHWFDNHMKRLFADILRQSLQKTAAWAEYSLAKGFPRDLRQENV